MFNGKIHYKWPFSIAMLNYQRVAIFGNLLERRHSSLFNIKNSGQDPGTLLSMPMMETIKSEELSPLGLKKS